MNDATLHEYRQRRDFGRTPEPAGDAPGPGAAAPRFVVQEHHARRLHWDLRLERDGVLASWAVPKGIPWSPEEDHLAVHTEDHPLEYLEFTGEIPEGSYGAGTMTIWDRGTYEPVEFGDRKVVVVLHGERVDGRYALFAVGGKEPGRERDWMIHRMDPPADPTREPVPHHWRPMAPSPGTLPADPDGWAFEIRWTGQRVLVAVVGGRATVLDGDGGDMTGQIREVRAVGPALGSTEALLDGVVVAVDREGRPLHDGEAVARRLAGPARRASPPVALMLFDLPWCDGHPLIDLPYEDRRARLAGLGLSGPAWDTPRHHVGDGAALLRAAAGQGVGGLVAKRLDGLYRPGERSPDWVVIDAEGEQTRDTTPSGADRGGVSERPGD